MDKNKITQEVEDQSQGFDIGRLTFPADNDLLYPIRYLNNYLPHNVKWLKPQLLSVDRIFAELDHGKPSCINHRDKQNNSIRLHPHDAQLPLYTGMEDFLQTRYAKANEDACRELLEPFAKDHQCEEIILLDKRSLASLSREQLESSIMDSFCRFGIYIFPQADESRIKLLGQTLVLVFMFDDAWENSSPQTIDILLEIFVSRLEGRKSSSSTDTPLERRMNEIRQGLLDADKEDGGNGGAEVLQHLISFCRHAVPHEEGYKSVRDYLDYRWADAATSWVTAGCKFSIGSSTSSDEPYLHNFLCHFNDLVSISNDIGSYEMERERFESGKALDMINIVHVIMTVDRVDVYKAKSLAYAWQLCAEDDILKDLKELKESGEMSDEDWRFVDANLLAAAENVLTSVVMARYGGKGSRI